MGMYEFVEEDAFRFSRKINMNARKYNNELRFVYCPYCLGGKHKDRDTFSISLDTGQFNCKRTSCDAHGNMITLSKDFDFSLGAEVDEYYNPHRRFRNIHRKEKPKVKPAAIAYMESRGISQQVTERYNITTQREHDNILVFPFYDENNILQFVKYRKTDFDKEKDKNKEWCEADCKPILFGMNHCNFDNPTLILTEGQIDSLSVVEAGIENAVSVPTGAKGFTWVPYCWDFLSRFSYLVVFGDFERETISLLPEMQKRFRGAIKRVTEGNYKGCKDANEILQKFGPEAVREAVEDAEPVKHPKIIRMADVERVDISKMEKITTGIDSLDRVIGGLYFGQLVLLTGERGQGKSTFASQIGTFAISSGYPVFIYSGELKNDQVKSWMEYQMVGDHKINKIAERNGWINYSVHQDVIPQLTQWYSDLAYMYDNTMVEDENENLLEILETSIMQYGCRVLMVDNLMTAISDDISSDLYRQQTQFVRQLAIMAKRMNVIIILIAHPRKTIGFEFGNNDVAGSSNITNLADVVIRYAKPKQSEKEIGRPINESDRIVEVYKNRLTGKTTQDGIRLFFQESSKRISEHDGVFDWELGWEETEFQPISDSETPFD